MKYILYLLTTVVLFSCGAHHKDSVRFKPGADTLVLHTSKQKGSAIFGQGAMPLSFQPDSVFGYSIVLPKGIDSVRRAEFIPDFRAKEKQHIPIITGLQNGKHVYIVDTNGNHNLTDDTVYPLTNLQWHNPQQLTECHYSIFNGEKMVDAVSWLNIGLAHGDVMAGRSEQLISSFSIGKDNFTIAVAEPRNSSFSFGILPQAAIVRHNEITKESISEPEISVIGEYLNLGGTHYRFANITNDGSRITLIKEPDFDKKTGTQPGMLAPDFIGILSTGVKVSSNSLKGKYIIIANSCACGGDKESATAAAEIYTKYNTLATIINLDADKEVLKRPYALNSQDTVNKNITNTYRGGYCSRMCYVIGPDKRIAGKFFTTAWKEYLPLILK